MISLIEYPQGEAILDYKVKYLETYGTHTEDNETELREFILECLSDDYEHLTKQLYNLELPNDSFICISVDTDTNTILNRYDTILDALQAIVSEDKLQDYIITLDKGIISVTEPQGKTIALTLTDTDNKTIYPIPEYIF